VVDNSSVCIALTIFKNCLDQWQTQDFTMGGGLENK